MSCRELVKQCKNLMRKQGIMKLHYFDKKYPINCPEFRKWQTQFKARDDDSWGGTYLTVEDKDGYVNRFHYSYDIAAEQGGVILDYRDDV